MKNVIVKSSLIVLTLIFILFSCGNKKKTIQNEEEIQISNLTFNYSEDYNELWNTVTSQEKKGLYKSALSTVQEILVLAKKDENTPQIVKCLIYKMKYNSYLKEDNYKIALDEIQQTASAADFPLKQILHRYLPNLIGIITNRIDGELTNVRMHLILRMMIFLLGI